MKIEDCKTVGEVKQFLSQYPDDKPFTQDKMNSILWENKGQVFSLTYHYLFYRFRQFVKDLLHLDAERLSTILFITVVTWLIYLLSATLHVLTKVPMLPDVQAVAIAGIYASAITSGARGAAQTLKTVKSLK